MLNAITVYRRLDKIAAVLDIVDDNHALTFIEFKNNQINFNIPDRWGFATIDFETQKNYTDYSLISVDFFHLFAKISLLAKTNRALMLSPENGRLRITTENKSLLIDNRTTDTTPVKPTVYQKIKLIDCDTFLHDWKWLVGKTEENGAINVKVSGAQISFFHKTAQNLVFGFVLPGSFFYGEYFSSILKESGQQFIRFEQLPAKRISMLLTDYGLGLEADVVRIIRDRGSLIDKIPEINFDPIASTKFGFLGQFLFSKKDLVLEFTDQGALLKDSERTIVAGKRINGHGVYPFPSLIFTPFDHTIDQPIVMIVSDEENNKWINLKSGNKFSRVRLD